jgi:hypothetical protein
VWVGLDPGRARARERLAARMEGFYRMPFDHFEKDCPYGTPGEIADFLAPYAEAGCRDFHVLAVASSSEVALDGVGEIRERLRTR